MVAQHKKGLDSYSINSKQVCDPETPLDFSVVFA
jgi:hypothetical protein